MCPLRIDPIDGQHRLNVMNRILNEQIGSGSFENKLLKKQFRVIVCYSPTDGAILDKTFLEKSALFSMNACTNLLQGRPIETSDKIFQMIKHMRTLGDEIRWGSTFFSQKKSQEILGT